MPFPNSIRCLKHMTKLKMDIKLARNFSITSGLSAEHNFKLVIVGGGAGGCGTANKFVSKFGTGEVGVIEPNTMHYYQPLWTLVGGGVKTLAQSGRPMESLLPKGANWLKDSVARFDPNSNCAKQRDCQTLPPFSRICDFFPLK